MRLRLYLSRDCDSDMFTNFEPHLIHRVLYRLSLQVLNSNGI